MVNFVGFSTVSHFVQFLLFVILSCNSCMILLSLLFLVGEDILVERATQPVGFSMAISALYLDLTATPRESLSAVWKGFAAPRECFLIAR